MLSAAYGIQCTRADAKLHLQGPSGLGSESLTGLSATCGIQCTRVLRPSVALAWVALICLAALRSHLTFLLPLSPADKDVLRLMQLADRFLMEDCVRRCATLLNQIPVSRC